MLSKLSEATHESGVEEEYNMLRLSELKDNLPAGSRFTDGF